MIIRPETGVSNATYVKVSVKDFFYDVLEMTQDFNQAEELLQRTIAKYEEQFNSKLSSKKAKKRLRDYATEQLKDNMEEVGRTTPERTTPHHIVAYDEPRGKAARQILAQVGIHINDERNGVYLPILAADTPHPHMPNAYPHKPVHTRIYYLNVATLLQNAYDQNRGNLEAQKGEVEETLREIAEELTDGTFPLNEEIYS